MTEAEEEGKGDGVVVVEEEMKFDELVFLKQMLPSLDPISSQFSTPNSLLKQSK